MKKHKAKDLHHSVTGLLSGWRNRDGGTLVQACTTRPTVQTESLKIGSHVNCHIIYNQGDTQSSGKDDLFFSLVLFSTLI